MSTIMHSPHCQIPITLKTICQLCYHPLRSFWLPDYHIFSFNTVVTIFVVTYVHLLWKHYIWFVVLKKKMDINPKYTPPVEDA